MSPAAKRLGIATAVLVIGALPPACASVGESDPPIDDRDASPWREVESGDGTPTVDAEMDAGPCSVDKICRATAPTEEHDRLLSVWGSSAADVWAVGSGGLILHYDGTVWEQAERVGETDAAASDYTMHGVWAGGRDNVWIADGTRIRHTTGWNGPKGTKWSFYLESRWSFCAHMAIRGFGSTVWAASDSCSHWMTRFEGKGLDGGEPQMLQQPPTLSLAHPKAIAMTSAEEVWVTSYDSQPDDVYQARTYRLRPVGTAGDPPMPDWQPEEYNTHTKRAPLGIWGNEHVVWAVGERGALVRLNRADPATKSFEAVAGPSSETLYGVFGFDVDDVWAVGDASTVLHWDGKSWTKLATPFEGASKKPRLWAVWGSSPSDVWFVGDGTVLRYRENGP